MPSFCPSSYLSSIFFSKFRNNDFRPFLWPSSYARSHNISRFAPSVVEAASLMNFLISSILAMVMKLKAERRVIADVSASSREVLAGWLVMELVLAVVSAAVSPRLAAFGCFDCSL